MEATPLLRVGAWVAYYNRRQQLIPEINQASAHSILQIKISAD